MPLATGPQTVLVFKHIQFLGNWTRWSGVSLIGYTANRSAQLLVVAEDETGAKTTYWFKVTNQDVWVIEDVAHIPAICLRSVPGDHTKCRGAD
jgi:hypothetical protein